MKKTLVILVLFFSSSVFAEEFKIDEKIINPLLIDCLFTNIHCEKSPEIIFFSNKAVERSQYDIKIIDDYYQFNIETKKSFSEFYRDEYGALTENKVTQNTYEFYPSNGHIKYKPVLELKDFAYLPINEELDLLKKNHHYYSINEELDLLNNNDGFSSYWLLKAESQEKLWCGKGYGECYFAFIVVELFKSQNDTNNNYIKSIKIIPYSYVDIKYGYDIKYVDRNADGFKDIVIYKITGGTGSQYYFEEIHFFNEYKTEVFENEYKRENTHWVGFMPNLDDEIYDLIRKEEPNISWNETISRVLYFTKGTFPSDNKFAVNTFTITILSTDNNENFELLKKITNNYAKNVSIPE